MLRRLPFLLILVITALPAAPAAATSVRGGSPPGWPSAVTITENQMRLVLQLPAAVYPRNALVPVTLRLSNLSARTVHTWDCLSASLGAMVSGPGGIDLYPDLLPAPGAPWASCPGELGMGPAARHPIAVAAGATMVRLTYIVLRAFTVRAWADLALTAGQMRTLVIQTPPIHIRRTAAAGPSVRIPADHPSPAIVTPVAGAGPIVYSEYLSCLTKSGSFQLVNASATFSRWTRAPGTIISAIAAPCARLEEWVLYVAQPGLPIAQAYYCRQHDRCAYAPPTPRERALAACKIDIGKAVTSGKLPRAAARYAIGLESQLPAGLTPAQQALASQFHARCAPLLKLHP